MRNKLIKLIIFWLLILGIFPNINVAIAQALPINSIIQEGLGNNTTEKPKNLPDPLRLTATWWAFFSSQNDEALNQGITDFLKRLHNQVDHLPNDEQKKYQTIINQITANFTAYKAIKDKKNAQQPFPKLVISQKYSLKELIDLTHQERDLNSTVQRLTLETNDYDKQIKVLSRQLNSDMAKYLDTSTTDNLRFPLGLLIVLNQTELVLINERYRSINELLSNTTTHLEDIRNVITIATVNITSSPQEIINLDTAIVHSEQKLIEANIKLSREQQFVATFKSTGTKEDAAVERYRELRVLNTQVNIATLEAQTLLYKMQKNLLELLLNNDSDTEKALKFLHGYNGDLLELTQKFEGRSEQNETERRRSTELLAETQAEGEQSQFLRNIIQDRSNLIQDTSINLQRLSVLIEDSEFIAKLTQEKAITLSGGWRNNYYKMRLFMSDSWRLIKDSTATALFKVGDTPVTARGIFRFMVILFVAWWVAFWINKLLLRFGNRNGGEKLPAYYLTGRLFYYSIVVIGFLGGLTIIGIDFTNFALVAGALAIGLGFGLQSIVNNFVSGLIILFERSLKVGDFIELQERDLRGEVRAINVRATIIADNDNVEIVIPNSELINTKMMNWTLSEPQRRIRYPFKVAYGVDKDIVRETVLKAAEDVPHTLKGIPGRNPAVWLVGFGEFYYEFELAVWLTARAVKRPNAVHAAYMWAIDTALRNNNIEVPIPQREMRFREGSVMTIRQYEGEKFVKNFENDIRDLQLSLAKKK